MEDIYWLYEQHNRGYCYCNSKLDIIDRQYCDNYCIECIPVKTPTIGDTDVPCNLNRKSYIKPGEECSICLELVMTKSTSYLSPCGHTFHKKCIFNAYESKMYYKYASVFKCPLCRQRIHCPEIQERYSIIIDSTYSNTLDELESFWLHKDMRMPEMCHNGYKHYIGFNKNCNQCIDYRHYGNIMKENI